MGLSLGLSIFTREGGVVSDCRRPANTCLAGGGILPVLLRRGAVVEMPVPGREGDPVGVLVDAIESGDPFWLLLCQHLEGRRVGKKSVDDAQFSLSHTHTYTHTHVAPKSKGSSWI